MIAKSKTGQKIEKALRDYAELKIEIEANPTANNPDLAKRYLEIRQRLENLSIPVNPISVLEDKLYKDNGLFSATFQKGFYVFDRKQILKATTSEYRKFLKDAQYGDIDNCTELRVAKGILKWDQGVRDLAGKLDLKYNKKRLTGNDGEYVVNINQTDGRRLVNGFGYNLLTTGLMYKLFIPYIKQEAQNGNADAQATLDEMISTKAEWLEDLVLGKNKVKIGSKEQSISIPQKDGKFDRVDLNEFGYPKTTKQTGEFNYWFPRVSERAVIRNWNSVLGLICNRGPGYVDDGLGVRLAKIL